MRNERVDSAPWFSFTRSGWSPSLHPPVVASYKRRVQIVIAEKPAEDTIRLLRAMALLRQLVSFKARGDRGASFDWLLIKARFFFTLDDKIRWSRSDTKISRLVAVLLGDKPLKRIDSSFNHSSGYCFAIRQG